MELSLISSKNYVFENTPCSNKSLTAKEAIVCVSQLKKLRQDFSTAINLHSKLNSSLFALDLPECQDRQLKNQIDFKLAVVLYYGPTLPKNAYWIIKDKSAADGLLKRLVCICGSSKNITASVELEMEDKVKLSFNDLKIWNNSFLKDKFTMGDMLVRRWGKWTKSFTGTISLTLKLNKQSFSHICMGDVIEGTQGNRKLLEDRDESGDVVVTTKNGEQVKCHKVFLAAKSKVFRAMFKTEMQEAKDNSVTMSDITERGLKALLDFLYCEDITEMLCDSSIAVELLQVSDKYGIETLFKVLKELILEMENESFSVALAVQLLKLLLNKQDDPDLGKIEKKAKIILKSKSDDDLDECEEFRNFFKNPDIGLSMCFFLREN